MKYPFDFNKEKSQKLLKSRGVGFEDIINAIENGRLLADVKHFNKVKYPHQRMFIVKIKNYAIAVPYVIDEKRKVFFLKTVYPDRRLTKKYLKNI